jgi:hypothetical protein
MFAIDPRLESFARGCLVRRQGTADLHQAYHYAFQFIGISPKANVIAACMKISNKMDSFASSKKEEPLYHNRHHTIDTLMALASLLKIGISQEMITSNEAVNAILAMNGHDMFHDGTVNTPHHNLEKIAAAEVRSILAETDFAESDSEIICDLIMKTDPAFQFPMRAQFQSGQFDTTLKLPLMVGDADLFASLLPTIGEKLSNDLAAEWEKAKLNIKPLPNTAQGRINFLSAVKWLSPMSVALGIDQVVKQQLAVIVV